MYVWITLDTAFAGNPGELPHANNIAENGV